ncbi:MAG: AtpZ/AtpI family protein [Gemmatimonadales bacterium]|nr:AtpZ/AtpI family protein [Gemmatimonadales bacterium]
MEPESGHGREIGEGYKYVSLGMTFAGGTILFMAAGFWIDRWLGLMPLFTIVGTLGGATLSFLNVYRKLQADEAKHKKRRQAKKDREARKRKREGGS